MFFNPVQKNLVLQNLSSEILAKKNPPPVIGLSPVAALGHFEAPRQEGVRLIQHYRSDGQLKEGNKMNRSQTQIGVADQSFA